MANLVLFANNAQTTLAGAITSTALTANLSPGSGVLFPAPATGQYFPITFVDEATQLLREIVYVTNVTGDVITMTRAQEGTTALAWNAGDIAANLLTAGSMQLMTQTPQIQANAAIYAADTGTANSYAVALSPASPVPKIGATVYFKALNANTGASTLSLNAGTAYALNAGVGGALVPNAIVAGSFCEAQFNGTAFNLIYATGGIAQSATPPVGDVSTSDATTAWVNSLLNGQSNIALTNANVTLTAAQYGQYILNFTGVLTGNVVVFFPAGVTGTWQVRNSTTGAYTLTLAVVGTPGSVLVVGSTAGSNTAVVYSDGTNVLNGSSSIPANNSITTAMLQAGAATLAKLDTTGLAGQALQGTGSGNAPAWAYSSFGQRSGLSIAYTGTTGVVTTTANYLTLYTTLGAAITLSSWSQSATSGTASGVVNSLDTGSWAYSTQYYLFAIYNPTTTTRGLLWSLSATAPTLPSGYAYFVRVGGNFTQSASNYYFLAGRQTDRVFQPLVQATGNVTAYTLLSSGVQGSVTTPTWVATSLIGKVPATAVRVGVLVVVGGSSVAMLAPNPNFGAFTAVPGVAPMVLDSSTGQVLSAVLWMTLETFNIYVASNISTAYWELFGWEDNL